jgi:hypothetical protein
VVKKWDERGKEDYMETYIIVPDSLQKIHPIFEQCGNLFRRKNGLFLYSSINEKCMDVARGISVAINCDFRIDRNLDSEGGAEKFPEKHWWPNFFIEILVVPAEVGRVIAKKIDPDCAYDNIPIDTLFRLKDVFPEERSDDDDVE